MFAPAPLAHRRLHGARRPRSVTALALAFALVLAPAIADAQEDDATTGSDAPPPTVPMFNGLTWIGDAYVGLAESDIHTSTDGIAWSVVHSSTTPLHHVAVGNGRVVVAGDGALLTAQGGGPDLKFSERAIAEAHFLALAFGGGKFVAIDATGRVHVGDGAGAWKTTTIAAGAQLGQLAFARNSWVAVGAVNDAAALFTAPDPAGPWTRANVPSQSAALVGVAHVRGEFVAADGDNHLFRSADGVTWHDDDSLVDLTIAPLTQLIAAGDTLYVYGSGIFTADDDGGWTALPSSQQSFWRNAVVRDGTLHVVVDDETTSYLATIDAACAAALADEEGSGMYGGYGGYEEPPAFHLAVDAPVRVTAFDGATVNRLAVSTTALYAATTKGLFKSTDGQAWERFGGIATPVDYVAAAAEHITIATKDGLSSARESDGAFTPVANARFKVRDLRGRGLLFVAIGDGAQLLLGTGGADAWHAVAVDGATRIASVTIDGSDQFQLLAETAGGVRWFGGAAGGEVWSNWTPLRNGRAGRCVQGDPGLLTLLESGSGVAYALASNTWSAAQVELPGKVTDVAPAGYTGSWLVTSRGLIGSTYGAEIVPVHTADGAVFTSVVDAGSSIVAAGQNGVIVIVPRPENSSDEPKLLASTPLSLVPADLALPAGATLEIRRTQGFTRVRTIDGRIYGLNGTSVRPWDARSGWGTTVAAIGSAGRLNDFYVTEKETLFVGSGTIATQATGSPNGTYSHWDFPGTEFRRLFFGNKAWVVFAGPNGVGEAEYPGSLSPARFAEDVDLRDAAWGNGRWVLVGARGDGARQPALFGGTSAKVAAPIALPVSEGALNAVLFDGARFVAVGERGVVATSTNGELWTTRQLAGEPSLQQVASGAGQIAALTTDGAILVSSDLATWRELPRDPQFQFTQIAGTPEALYLIGPDVTLASAAPASAWTSARAIATREFKPEEGIERVARVTHSKIAGGGIVYDVVWDGARFVTTTYQQVIASTNGRDFSPVGSLPGYGGGIAVAAGSVWVWQDQTLRSANAGSNNFTTRHTTSAGTTITGLAASGSTVAFAVSNGNVFVGDTAAKDWWAGVVPGARGLNGLATDGVHWVTLGTRESDGRSVAAVSADARAWRLVELGEHTGGFTQLAWGQGRFVALEPNAQAIATSTDGETWEVREFPERAYLGKLAFTGGRFYLACGNTVLASDDGLAWKTLGIDPGATPYGITAAFGQLYITGSTTGDVNLTRAPVPDAAQVAAAPAVALRAHEGFARRIADWDVAMTAAKNSTERLKLCRELHGAWRAASPNYTRETALAFLAGMHARVLGYEISNETVYTFISDLGDFSQSFMQDYLRTQPQSFQDVVKEIASDTVATYAAQQRGEKPPPAPNRVNTRSSPPQPMVSPAQMDIAALRLRAARGDKLAAYALCYYYNNGTGVPKDPAASSYWRERAVQAGLVFRQGAENTPEEITAAWKVLAEQGSPVAQNALGERCRDGTGIEIDHAAAVRWFQQAVAGGNWDAHVNLGRAYREGKGVACDLTAARRLFEAAAAIGYGRALAEIGWFYEAAAGETRDLAMALAYYEKAAAAGNTWAARRTAEFHFAGHGVTKDEAKARVQFQALAEAGDEAAKKIIAEIIAGQHRPVTLATYDPPKKARPLFDVAARRAQADAGDAAACYDLAYIHWNGHGVDLDTPTGNQWLAKAKQRGWKHAEKWETPADRLAGWRAAHAQGSLVAADQLARMLNQSDQPWFNVAESIALFQQAAAAGHVNAQAELGLIHETGRGAIAADGAKAFEWYLRAADGGNAFAQMKVGYRYETGTGVTRDDAKGLHYYRLGAEGGNKTAAANLAALLSAGRGAPADPKAACGWYLTIAGRPNSPTEPAEAWKQIQQALADGTSSALGALAIMARRGVGTAADPTEAWAYQHAAEAFDATVYSTDWFNNENIERPRALRRAAEFIDKAWAAELAAFTTNVGGSDATTKLTAGRTEAAASARDPEKSTIARALRALADGTATDEVIQAAHDSIEPLRIPGLLDLWNQRKATPAIAGQPWTLHLAGLAEKPADEAAAEAAFTAAALYTPDDADEAGRARIETLRAIQVARHAYGIGCEESLTDALAWALVNEAAEDSFYAINFLDEDTFFIEAADARFLGLEAQRLRLVADTLALGNRASAIEQANTAYRAAAYDALEAGDLASTLAVAAHHEDGAYGFEKNATYAYDAWLKAAGQNDTEAHYRVGVALVHGTGVAKNLAAGKASLEKAAAAGHAAAKTVLAELAASDARAAQRTPPDKKTGPVDAVVFDALASLQNDTATATLGEPAIVALLKAVWWDAEYSPLDEDLARELNDATARPLVVTAADGRTLSFTKTVDAAVANAFPQYLQGEFNVLNGEYYKTVFQQTVIAGVFIGGCRVNENGRSFMRARLSEVIFEGVKHAAGQGTQTFQQIFDALKTSHDAANPALQAEFRAEIRAAIALIEQQNFTVPAEWKNLAWLQ